jgi:hypothetical protein
VNGTAHRESRIVVGISMSHKRDSSCELSALFATGFISQKTLLDFVESLFHKRWKLN